MRVAILTMFNGLSNTYSLVNVVAEQLKMLLDDGVNVKMLVSESCPDSDRYGIFLDTRIEWIKIVNSRGGVPFYWKTYTKATDKIEKSFYDESDIIAEDFKKHLANVDVCIMHDILYQGVHLLHNVAIRKAQLALSNVKFLSFTHSAPATKIDAPYPINCMFSDMPNTTFIYPTECGLPALSKQYGVGVEKCVAINNSVDTLIGVQNETKIIAQNIDLFSKDVLIVYPARLNMSKRFHIIAQFGGLMKQYCKKNVGIIFCDFASADINPETYKLIISDYGAQNGLDKNDLLFTSNCGFANGVKRETVFDLFALSNLFMCPSYSESFGLTVIEAASRGNFIVLNEAVPALKEIGDSLNAYYMRWSARNFDFETTETYHPNEQLYYIENAQNILIKMQNNPVINAKTLARTRYSNCWIYQNQLKPLLQKLTQK
ncbi:MAG: glycosyltransferase [Clostridia bacterium]